jgi:predicted ester cyclase
MHTIEAVETAYVEKIRTLLEQVWEHGLVDLADDVLSANVVNHDKPVVGPHGLEWFKEHVHELRAASSDLHVEIEHIFGSGDWVAARIRWQGVHDGPLFGLPASNRRIDVPQHSLWRFADGKATDFWYCWDETSFLVQTGIVPPPDTTPLGRWLALNLGMLRVAYRQLHQRLRRRG